MHLKSAAVAALAATALTTGTAGAAITQWDPATAAFIHGYAVEQGTAVEVSDELLPFTLDLHDWLALAQCESSGRWHIRDASGRFGGGVQIAAPDVENWTIEDQLDAARSILDRQGPRAWPVCSRVIGWRN